MQLAPAARRSLELAHISCYAGGLAVGSARVPPQDDRWLIVASVLFLASIALSRGLQHPTVVRNQVLEPETAALLLELLPGGTAKTSLTEPLPVVLPRVWDRVQEAAVARRLRTAM